MVFGEHGAFDDFIYILFYFDPVYLRVCLERVECEPDTRRLIICEIYQKDLRKVLTPSVS